MPTCDSCLHLSQETVVNFAKRCGQIIDLAVDWAPRETKAILEVGVRKGVKGAEIGDAGVRYIVVFKHFLMMSSLESLAQSYVSQEGLASQGLIHHSGISMATQQLHQLHLHNSSSMHIPVSFDSLSCSLCASRKIRLNWKFVHAGLGWLSPPVMAWLCCHGNGHVIT